MVWFFERDTTSLRCEIRREMDGSGFELVTAAGADETVEKVDSPAVLLTRSHRVWTDLLAKGWRPIGPGPHRF